MNELDSSAARLDRLERRIVAALESAAYPDPVTERRLQRVRAEALGSVQPHRRRLTLALPLATMAAVAIVTLTLVIQQPSTPTPMPMTSDVELLMLPEFDWVVGDPELAQLLLNQVESLTTEQSG